MPNHDHRVESECERAPFRGGVGVGQAPGEGPAHPNRKVAHEPRGRGEQPAQGVVGDDALEVPVAYDLDDILG